MENCKTKKGLYQFLNTILFCFYKTPSLFAQCLKQIVLGNNMNFVI